jgi:hypothetical protein
MLAPLATSLLVVVVAIIATVGGRHGGSLAVMNHVVESRDTEQQHHVLLPQPERQYMASATAAALLDNNADSSLHKQAQRCPDECRCENDDGGLESVVGVECWNVGSLPDLLADFGAHWPSLTSLSITYCDGRQWLESKTTDGANSTTANKYHRRRSQPTPLLPSLVELTLAGCPVDDDVESSSSRSWLDRLLSLPQLAALRRVRAADNNLGTLLLSQRVASLESLDLASNRLAEVQFVGGEWPNNDEEQLARLTSLNLADNRLTAFALAGLVRRFPSLQRLNLSANSLQDISSSDDVITTAGGGVSQLSQLDLSRNPQLELVCNALLFRLPNLGMPQLLKMCLFLSVPISRGKALKNVLWVRFRLCS